MSQYPDPNSYWFSEETEYQMSPDYSSMGGPQPIRVVSKFKVGNMKTSTKTTYPGSGSVSVTTYHGFGSEPTNTYHGFGSEPTTTYLGFGSEPPPTGYLGFGSEPPSLPPRAPTTNRSFGSKPPSLPPPPPTTYHGFGSKPPSFPFPRPPPMTNPGLGSRQVTTSPTTYGVGNKPKEPYQIFLCFRGEDTRHNFTRYLYDALKLKKFNVFMDDRSLERGDSISQVIMETIENTKLSIIVFSEDFASSSWCLDEVFYISECRLKKNQIVLPIFYNVEPSDVRNQKNTYEPAMKGQEKRFGEFSARVLNWKSALYQVSCLSGFPYKKNTRFEGDFVQEIVEDVIKKRHLL